MAEEPRPRHPEPDPTVGPLAERPFPGLADALRSRVEPILRDWERQVRRHVPPAHGTDLDRIRDGLPAILAAMADALASGEPAEVGPLLARSPEQGVGRFQMHYDVRDLATEDRLLRRLIVGHVGAALGRRTGPEEDAALHWAIDLMLQQAMVAFVEHQSTRLRAAAEAELKYLSFLSHDLSGNLGSVTLWLQVLRRGLGGSPQFAEQVAALDAAQQSILDTMGGMGRLLQAERLRHRDARAATATTVGPVGLRDLASDVALALAPEAERKGVRVAVEVPPEAVVTCEGELVRLVLQNLIGNAVKYASRGAVRVGAERRRRADGGRGGWVLSVSDEGPGIAAEHLGRIFEAFGRGEVYGQAGVGLGLAIASRAAKLLGAALTVESKVGVGSTFRLAFPMAAADDAAEGGVAPG